jgi:hypothetical protein
VRKGGAWASFNTPERGKKRRPKKGARGCLPVPESAKNKSRYGGSGDGIGQPCGSNLRGERKGKERRARGFIGEVLNTIYSWNEEGE